MHGWWRALRDPDKGLAYLRQTVANRPRSVPCHRGVQARHSPPVVADMLGISRGAAKSMPIAGATGLRHLMEDAR
jgi:hypothetical protein